ncbi:hypothetical protein [Arsenophonus endosymbiont of Crataerina pallida]|uniref:hypothetical protein n=1 Tax=Arsenophonus endosymbiont of Crataerina pallida TaxID=3066235 RepID=UPI0030D15DAB
MKESINIFFGGSYLHKLKTAWRLLGVIFLLIINEETSLKLEDIEVVEKNKKQQ